MGGGYYFRFLILCCAMTSGSLVSSAQSGQSPNAATSAAMSPASGTSTSADGYRINGETQPAEPGRKYLYTREMPDGSKDVYWHVEGAIAIDGAPATNFPDGSLDANEHAELTIQWDLDAKEGLALQLRRNNPESKAGFDVLADLAIGAWPATCTGHIEYFGLASNPTSSGVHNDQFLCPAPPAGQFGAAPRYLFRYQTPDCNYFIWTLKYHTANGGVYVEQWRDSYNRTAGIFTLYTQVPTLPYDNANYPQINPITGLPTSNYTPYNYTPAPGPVQPQNALAGQAVLSIDVQCTGYRSFACDISDEMHTYYTGVLGDIGAIAANGTAPYCRDQPVTLSVNGAAGATANTTYSWTLVAGSFTGITPNGTSATLNLRSVPPTAGVVTIQVQATDNSCAGPPSVTNIQTITLPLVQAAPQPQGLLPLPDVCPSLALKPLRVIGGPQGTNYEWRVTGTSGAQLIQPGTTNTLTSLISSGGEVQFLVAPRDGNATVTVTALGTTCTGNSVPLVQVFNIGAVVPVAPTFSYYRSGCASKPNLVYIDLLNTLPGLTYRINRPYNVTGGGTATIPTPTFGTSVVMTYGGAKNYFDIDVDVVSQCPFAIQTFTFARNFVQKFVDNGQACRPASDGGGVTSAGNEAAVSLYPNPTDGTITIRADDETTHYQWAKVVDSQGRVVQEKQADNLAGISELNLSALPTGLYQVQLFDGTRLTTQRVVRQ